MDLEPLYVDIEKIQRKIQGTHVVHGRSTASTSGQNSGHFARVMLLSVTKLFDLTQHVSKCRVLPVREHENKLKSIKETRKKEGDHG
jgi:hypothetical protein